MKSEDFFNWLKSAYDRLTLFVVLAALLLSVGWLLLRITEECQELSSGREDADATGSNKAKSVDVGFIEDTRLQIRNPFQSPEHPRRLLTSEWRLPCLNCNRPIPFDANKCPFCLSEQPDVTTGAGDRDGDQMPDDYERAHGLNPNDPTDAGLDSDKDGFTNLEEYLAGTDPFDALSSPPPILKSRLVKVRTIPISIVWIGTSVIAENKPLFTIRDMITQREHYVEMEGNVSGFKVAAFDRQETNVVRGGVNVPVDTSILTVQRGERSYALKLNQMTKGDIEADILFIPEDRQIKVRTGMDVKFKTGTYKIIDISQNAVVASDIKTGLYYRVGLDKTLLTASSGQPAARPDTSESAIDSGKK